MKTLIATAALAMTLSAPAFASDQLAASLGVAPANSPGPCDVEVVNPDLSSGTLMTAFSYTSPPPTISSVSPNIGETTGGTPVTIEILFGLVKLGTTQCARRSLPCCSTTFCIQGMTPAAMACSM